MTPPTPDNSSEPPAQASASSNALGRRIAGIGALFACALVVDPGRVVPTATSLAEIDIRIALHALVIPALATLGLWLVIPSTTVISICVLLLAAAHADPGASDLFSGYLYPALALIAGAYLVKSLLFTNSAS